MTRRLSWSAMAALLLIALAIGVTEDRAPRTEADRVNSIAAGIRCPTCAGLSAAESDAAAAQAVRDEIRDRLRKGESEEQIEAYFVSRFGRSILLTPEAGGVAGLVWVLPVAGAVLVAGALTTTLLRRRREQAASVPTSDDRALVDRALEGGA